jgi:hypothetical protein
MLPSKGRVLYRHTSRGRFHYVNPIVPAEADAKRGMREIVDYHEAI